MPDNVFIEDANANDVPIAADVVGGVAYQRVKSTWGEPDVTPSDTSLTNPQPVQDAVARTTLAQIAASRVGADHQWWRQHRRHRPRDTSAKQDTGNTALTQLHTDLASVLSTLGLHATETTLAAVRNALTTLNGAVATAALQTTNNAKLDTLHNDILNVATQTGVAQVKTAVDASNTALALLHTDNGAQATAALQTTGNTSLTNIKTALDAVNAALAGTLDMIEPGVPDWTSVTAAGNVNVPTGARIKEISVAATSGGTATVTVLGKLLATVPASLTFDWAVPGSLLGTSSTTDVVFAGNVASGFVSWVA
jgi:hypothetical protein